MPATLRHFSINADDTARGRRFYREVFGWTFEPWGPPGFLMGEIPGAGVSAALQGRHQIDGEMMPGLTITFGVDDIPATLAAIEANGGSILMQPYVIEGVGELIYFKDSEGNVAGAMNYLNPPPS
jgi:predicted enzyme related to lactoylglutathione lyase